MRRRAELLGTSTLNIPFAFPSSTVAGKMAYYNAPTSSYRAEQILTYYWDGIDEKAIRPLTGTNASKLQVMSYLVGKSISKNEASAFVNAMFDLDDKSWLSPRWGWTKTLIQDTSGTGEQGSGGSKATLIPTWTKTAVFGGLIVAALIAIRPYAALIPRRKSN